MTSNSEEMSQSLLNQVNGSDGEGAVVFEVPDEASQSLLNQVNGSDEKQEVFEVSEILVSIPSKSGQWFRYQRFGVKKILTNLSQSLLNQVNGSDEALNWGGAIPYKSQSLLNQVNGSDQTVLGLTK